MTDGAAKGSQSQERRPRGVPFPLRLKLGALAALAASLPLVVVGFLLIEINAEAVRVLSLELQMAVVDDVARTVEGELADAVDGLHAAGRILTDSTQSGDGVIAQALALVEGEHGVDHVAVYDSDGALIDVIREEGAAAVETPELLPEEIRSEAGADNVAVGAAIAVEGEAPRILIAVPLRGRGRITGYAASSVSLAGVQERVERMAAGRFQGAEGSVLVVDERLRILAHPDRPRAANLQRATDLGIFSPLVENGRLPADVGWSGEHVASDGTPMIGTVASLPALGWAVAVQLPRAVAYASLGRMRSIIIATVAAAIILSVLAGVLLASRLTAPVARLADFSRDLAARRFGRRVVVDTGDELSLLARALNLAAADLEESEAQLTKEAAIRSDLGRYLPAELVEKVVRREQDMALGGQRREVTVLFADVVAFTPLTEKLEPEEVVTILNELFTILSGIVFRQGGTVDKFIGDCVMAVFGAPTAQEDHAERALSAAEDMLAWLELGNETWRDRYGVTIRIAVGINSGEAVVGNVGSETRMEYTAIGDVVNVAARLESMARPQQILVTEATRDAAGDGFDFVDAGEHEIQGVSEAMRLFEVRPA